MPRDFYQTPHSIVVLENVEHCGGKPEQADTGIYEYTYVIDE